MSSVRRLTWLREICKDFSDGPGCLAHTLSSPYILLCNVVLTDVITSMASLMIDMALFSLRCLRFCIGYIGRIDSSHGLVELFHWVGNFAILYR